jgi:hypothetical protein
MRADESDPDRRESACIGGCPSSFRLIRVHLCPSVVVVMQIQVEHFVPSDIALRLALSIGVGLFVGFEREWSRKEMGVRSFAITALLGTLSALIGGHSHSPRWPRSVC